MMRTWDEIATMTAAMMRDETLAITKMREVNTRYSGDYVIPFPDLDNEPELPPLTPMLVGESIDQLGMRASQVQPINYFPALDADKMTGVRSAEYAAKRRGLVHASYRYGMWELQKARFFRQLVAYNTASLIVLPDLRHGCPTVQVRDPLSTFAERVDDSTPRPPSYVAFVTRHSGDWLRRRYPATREEQGGPISTFAPTEYQWEVVEWVDEDQVMFGLLGPVVHYGPHVSSRMIERPTLPLAGPYPQLAEVPIAVCPRQVTLAGIASRIGNMLGMVDLMAKLQGFDILSQQKSIFPDMYAIGSSIGDPTIIGGRWKDGTTGEVNLLRDVEQIGVLRTDPSPATQNTIDRMERNWRVSTGLNPQFGGETFNSLRTGRAIDAMTQMSVDPRIMELHRIASAWLPFINEAILSTYKAMWPTKRYFVPTGLGGDLAMVDAVPATHIEQYANAVEYPFPGADITQQTQILGSLLGTGAISRGRFRKLHPWIEDDAGEAELVRSEQIEDALMQSIQTQIAQGALPVELLAVVHDKLANGKTIFEAIREAQREAQERQATEAPPPEPGQVAAPETMPGLNAPPEAQVQPGAEQVQVPVGAQRMRQLMQAMGQ